MKVKTMRDGTDGQRERDRNITERDREHNNNNNIRVKIELEHFVIVIIPKIKLLIQPNTPAPIKCLFNQKQLDNVFSYYFWLVLKDALLHL